MKRFIISYTGPCASYAATVASILLFVFCGITLTGLSTGLAKEADSDFVTPTTSRPWAYYWWLKGNVTPEAITHDLEAMQAKGFGGILLFDSRRYYDEYDSKKHVPVPLHIKHEFMSPQWRKLVVHTVKEANRLGLAVSMNIADSGGILRGPWELGANGPKELVWTQENVRGPKRIVISLDKPVDKKYYKDIGVFAVRIVSPVSDDFVKEKLGEQWSNAVQPVASSSRADNVTDLTASLVKSSDGTARLEWNVPAGNWKILRLGYHVIGDTGSVDILNEAAVTDYFHRMCTQVLKDNGDLAGKTLSHFYNVSWEGSNPDWTDGFEVVFAEKRKYDIRPNLPVLCGLIVNDLDYSTRFLRDFYKTVADSFREHCYACIGRLCHERGILWHSEDGGPWRRTAPIFRQADMLSYWGQNDIAQGEFWVNPTNNQTRSNMRACAMASHIYGHNDVACEAFTHMTKHWSMFPGWLKPAADVNFIDGMNMIIWHTFTASPPEKGKPGFEYFAGTHVNTNVTWWNDLGPFVSYLGRCQYLLRKGKPVADVCVYVSDSNYVGWGRLERWNNDSTLVLPKGYSYDLLDTNVLVNNLKYNNGRLTLPHGTNYKILVFDPLEKTIPVEAVENILKLVQDGATVVLGPLKPSLVPGLTNYPDADHRLNDIVNQLWGKERRQGCFPLGKGKVCIGMTMDEVLASEKIIPDFTGSFEYNHRADTNRDIFFVTGAGREECLFRVPDRQPVIWNPQTGMIEPVIAWRRVSKEQTAVTLDLPKNGSTFVVFAGKPEKNQRTCLNGPGSAMDTAFSLKGSVDTFWQDGTWKATDAAGCVQTFDIKVHKPLELAGPWNVAFDPAWGGPSQVVFDKLVAWNNCSQPGIKFYSGTAVYTKTFQLDAQQVSGPIRLSLGKVDNIARVKLNGNDLGVVWTDPWTIDLTGKIVKGENRLEIAVTNCWVNRLIGDAALAKEKRLTKTNVYLVKEQGDLRRFQGYWSTDPLQASGLTGPVRIEFGQTMKRTK